MNKLQQSLCGALEKLKGHAVYQKETLHVNDISSYYNVGAFRMTISIQNSNVMNWMKNKYVVVTTGSELLTSDLILTEDKQHWKSREINGILYDNDFPTKVEVQLYDEKHLTINNHLPSGYYGCSNLSSKYKQDRLKVGEQYFSEVNMELHNVMDDKKEEFITCTIDIEYDYDRSPEATDTIVNEQYHESMTQAKVWYEHSDADGFHKKHKGLEAIHVVLVPGLFTNAYPGYFDENMKALKKLNIDHSVAPISTKGSVRKNGSDINEYIQKICKDNPSMRIILMCHSKGGCDVLDALANSTNEEAIKDSVFGVINMQSPLHGTEFIDYLNMGNKGKAAKKLGAVFDNIFKCDASDAVFDLSTQERKTFLDSLRRRCHDKFSIPELFDVHFLSFCSWADYGVEEDNVYSKASVALMRPTNKVIECFGQRSDGMVPLHSGRVPGGDCILVSGAYHTSPAIHMSGNPVHTGYLTIALLDTMLTRHPLHVSMEQVTEARKTMTADRSVFNLVIDGYRSILKPPPHTKSPTRSLSDDYGPVHKIEVPQGHT